MRLEDLMRTKKLSKRKLSMLSGVERLTISRLLEKKDCRLSTLRRIAKALGVKVSDLIEDEGESEEPHPSPQRVRL